MKAFLTANKVARLVDVDRATVGRWIKQGRVKGAHKVAGKQGWRIPFASYEELVKSIKQHEGN